MTKKFDPKVNQGKRVKVAIPGSQNIRRHYMWNGILNRYVDPPRGGKYESRRSRGIDGSRDTRMFETLGEAREWQIGRNAPDPSETPLGVYSIRDLLNDWQRLSWPTMKETTRIFYLKATDLFKPLLNVEVESLKPRHIDEWLMALRSPEYVANYRPTRVTFEKEFETLKTMVRWYIDTHDETKLVSPFKKRHTKLLDLRERQVTQRFMQPVEFEKWLSELKRDSFLFYVMGLTQTMQLLRVSEVAAMKWSNLTLVESSYQLCEHVIWPRVDGRPPQVLAGTKTMKSGKSYTIPLREDVVEALQELSKTKHAELIFTENGNPLTYRRIQHKYDNAFKRAGLPYRGTHVCRHTGATTFLDETGDFLALQQMGGWSDLKMALHYGQILSTRARRAVEKADEKRRHLRLVKAKDDVG